MTKKIDLRVLKTKKAIKEAFLSLVKEKSYSKITVKDIVEEALINRNTFYLHYLDKDDLLDKLTSECMDRLDASMNSVEEVSQISELSYEGFKTINDRMFMAIKEDYDFYKVVLGDESIPYLSVKFHNVIRNHIGVGMEKERAFYIEYLVSGLVGIIKLWIRDPEKYSIDEVSKLLINIHSTDMIDLLSK